MEFDKILAKCEKCYLYRDYQSAIFLSSVLSASRAEYNLLTGILLYLNKEYTRSLPFLLKSESTTALYYRCLSLFELKKYGIGLEESSKLLRNQTSQDARYGCMFLDSFIIDNDVEFFELLHGKFLIQESRSSEALNFFISSLGKNVLFPVVEELYKNNIMSQNTKFDDPIEKYYADICNSSRYISSYEDHIPGHGSYYLSKVGLRKFQEENKKSAMNKFVQLKKQDPSFSYEMDQYSAYFWKYKNDNLLGLLSKDLIDSQPMNEVTWIVIANYYSLNNDIDNCISCLEKANSIKETALAYTLLGFEYNGKSQFNKAEAYFKSSLGLQDKNSRALFGMGIAYDHLGKPQQAEGYLLRGLELQPNDTAMQAFLVGFYTKRNDGVRALSRFKEFMGFREDVDLGKMINDVKRRLYSYKYTQELMLLEFLNVMVQNGYREDATFIYERIKVRSSSYYDKRNLIDGIQ